ncbi:hypothetical protein [Pectinatus sottacetonis]|uniref:hypothetical protein n=1 Tax=Pectinatus sottacetonis TaxID=1002795 RepID=UPI0018C5127F|nr:hypothetical protein [Pectinatus sottacetonis]
MKVSDNVNIVHDGEILAILPRYTERGDGTVIVSCDGKEVFYSKGEKPVLKEICNRYCKDIHLMRDWARQYTGQKIWMPLGFSWELVLVPMRIRGPKIQGDETLGYFNYLHINDAVEVDNKVYLVMENNTRYLVLWSLDTVKQHLKDAMLIHSMMTQRLDDTLWQRLSRAIFFNGPVVVRRYYK